MGIVALITYIGYALTVISIGLSIYQMFQKPPEPPVPAPRGVTGVPEAVQGMDVPVLFGTRWISKSNVVWWGNPHSTKITVNASELQ